MAKRKSLKPITAILVIVILLIAAWRIIPDLLPKENTSSAPPASSDSLLIAEFLDVDQADCALFHLPDGKKMLVDAGERGDGEEIVEYLKSKKISKIDYLIATHPHSDHIGGMSNVVDSFEIGKIFAPKVPNKQVPISKTYKEFLTSVQNKGLKMSSAKAGTTLFEGVDYKAECFAPNSSEYDELNDYSVIVKLTYGVHSFLLTGDAEALSEGEMIKAGYDLESDVLKVGHHGSSTSSSKAFLAAVSPRYAVISCGTDNTYGHPHKETLDSFKRLGGLEKTFRTDIDKTIIFKADGKTKDGLKYTVNNQTVVE